MKIIRKSLGTTDVSLRTAGQGKPLLFLHGFEGPVGDAGFLKSLAGSYTVLAPEHPGFGESGGFERHHDIIDLVLHYRALIESVVDEPVILIGHSLGGMFAAEIAALCPHLISKLVLIDSYGLWLDDHPILDPFILNRAELVEAKWAAQDPSTRNELETRSLASGEDYRLKNLGSATHFMWPIPDRGLGRRIGAIHASTLIVHGEQDALVPKVYAHAFGDRLRDSRVELIANAGHFPMIEQEAVFLDKVGDFLS